MTTRVLLIEPCTTIQEAGRALCAAATEYGGTVEADFNGVLLTAEPGTQPDQVVASFYQQNQARKGARLDAVALVHRKAAAFDKLEAYLQRSGYELKVEVGTAEVGYCCYAEDWDTCYGAPTLLELVEKLEEA